MTRRSHLAAWLLLWLVGLLAWPLWCGPARLVERARDDLTTLHQVFGPRIAASLAGWADLSQQGFGHDDLRDLLSAESDPGATPGGDRPSRYRSALADRVAHQADRHLAAVRLQLHGAVLRAATLLAWWVLLMPLVLAAVVDGLAERAIKGDTFGYQSPAAFSLSGHALIAGAMLPVLALAAPVSLPPWLTPAWLLGLLLPLRSTLAHMQPVFTR